MDADAPWEDPNWYDQHDTTWTAGPEREPEHYREIVLALPPLDRSDHLVDIGAGTGKLAALVATAYPRLGAVTLIEPNSAKVAVARQRLRNLLPRARINARSAGLGRGQAPLAAPASIVTVGSVLMPTMELRGGTLANGLDWLRRALADLFHTPRPGGWLYALETLAAPWARGQLDDPVRRLQMLEMSAEIAQAGFSNVECVYRFRDRVALRARRPW